jgi:nucleoid DNA-binding protein
MDKDDLASRLARQTRRSKAAAADEVDRVVHQILAKLRRGERAPLPGLGTFLPGQRPGFGFEFEPKKDTPEREPKR